MFEQFKKFWLTSVSFSKRERVTFLALLRDQLEGRGKLSEIFKNQRDHPFNKHLVPLAERALDNINDGVPIASDWHEDGHFTLVEATLLRQAEDRSGRSGLLEAVEFLLQTENAKVSFWRNAIFGRPAIIIGAIYFIGFGVFVSTSQKDVIDDLLKNVGKSSEDIGLMQLSDALFGSAGAIFTIILTLLVVTYITLRQQRISIDERERYKKLGLFNYYDRTFEYEVCGIVHALMRQQMTMQAVLETLEEVYLNNRFKNARITMAKRAIIDGTSPLEALRGNLMSDRYYFVTRLGAGETPTNDEIARSIKRSQNSIVVELQRDYLILNTLIMAICGLTALGIGMSLFEVMIVLRDGTQQL